jgi:signal transduction histidine kinase
MIDRSLELLRLQTPDAQLTIDRVVVRDLIAGVVAAHQERAAAKGLALVVAWPADHLALQGDARLLHRALDIVLDNAVKFSPPGGQIMVGVEQDAGGVAIGVEDSGPGVADDMRAAIFDGQVEDALTRRQGGVGLNLLLARRIAELHGGGVRPAPLAQGTRFTLWLPYETGAPLEVPS